jgi:hypothetical protein
MLSRQKRGILNTSVGQAAAEPVHVSIGSQLPVDARQTVPAVD